MLVIALGLLVGCGLEPRPLALPTPVGDGRAVWVTAGADPPGGDYAPLLIGEPAVGVCRAWLTIPKGSERDTTGYIVGEVGQDGMCRVPEGGEVFTFTDQFAQLYIRAGVVYSWATRDELRPDASYQESKLWANNAVPVEIMRRPDGSPAILWLPCAAEVGGRWRVGKLALHDLAETALCAIPGDGGEIRVRPGYRALYVPLDQ